MASRNAFLVNWVKSAYGMEMGLVPMLEQQTKQLKNDPELRKGLDVHLQKTRQHADLLRDYLTRAGENVTAIQPTRPVTAGYDHQNGGVPDTTRQTELLNYVTEAFEAASYRALRSLASMVGDQEAGRLSELILSDEEALVDTLDKRLPGHSGNGHKATAGAPESQNITLARENFAALNAHDLDRAERQFAPDFRSIAPGSTAPLDRVQNRAYIQNFLTAFPDLHFEVQRTIGSGDEVVVEWLGSGTNTGPMRSPAGDTIPATHRTSKVRGNTVFQFKEGKITQSRVLFDTGEMMQQLGLMSGTEKGSSAVAGATTAATGAANRGIVHLEIPATDRQAAARFYGEMFGWTFEHMGPPMNYTMFKTGNVEGGFPELGPMYKPGDVLFYVESKNIDADLRKAEKLGAKTVTPRTEIPGMGWFAILTDPTGNRVGLYTG